MIAETSQHLRAPDDSRPSRAERTAELFARTASTTESRRRLALIHQIVLENRGVAEAVARRFHGRDVEPDDLQQVAYEALVKAAHRFDPSREHDFLSYAVPTIRGELQRYFRDHGWVVRPTRGVQEAQWRIAKAEGRLMQDLGRTPTRHEVCDVLSLSEREYDEAMAASGCFRPSSLDQPLARDGDVTTIGDLLADDSQDLAPSEARAMLAPVVRQLSRRDQRVLYLRFYEGRTQQEIGDLVGVTQTQVSRILDQVLRDLREQLTDDDPPPAA
jgi:RNA polymerase sigma-B factor